MKRKVQDVVKWLPPIGSPDPNALLQLVMEFHGKRLRENATRADDMRTAGPSRKR